MSLKRLGGLLALVAASTVWLPAAAAAEAAGPRIETIALPSAGNVDVLRTRLNGTAVLEAKVLLPAGYEADPARRWPVVYLLHGVADNSSTWLDRRYGDAAGRLRDLEAIVVMPEAGRGFFVDAWRGGQRSGPNWERYYLEEVIPQIEARYRILPGRENHSIGGISMGGYGAFLLAADLPSYFGSAFSLSGLLDLQEPAAQFIVPMFTEISFPRIWGPYGGPWQQANNPAALLPNLRNTRLFVSSGNGLVDPKRPFDLEHMIGGSAIELASLWSALSFTQLARRNRVPVTLAVHGGVHDWPYFRRDLTRAVAWGLFGGGRPETPTDFRYRTMKQTGNAFGVGFRFTRPPRSVVTLTKSGDRLTASGPSAEVVTLTPGAAPGDASGRGRDACAVTSSLPLATTISAECR